MCGFAGFINFESQKYQLPERLQVLRSMGQQLSRRGPDDEQLYNDRHLSFIFRRLSIVDLDGGKQPIWNEDRTIFVAVNGEIYNHQELRSQLRSQHHFRTHSDAEVVLHLYEEMGASALDYLNGMFAIAIWDTQRQQLFLARDRLGIKPLYYTQIGAQLIFGSELKALLAHPDSPRQPRWKDFNDYLYRPTLSYIRGIHLLPGGHYFTFNQTGIVSPKRYWAIENYFPTEPVKDSRKSEDYVAQYRDLFTDSVKKRLMSNVPVGAFLSGGLDSSAVVAAASQFIENLHCFTNAEKSFMQVGDVAQAKEICDRFQLPFHPIYFDNEHILEQLDFSLANFEYFIWLMDAPRFNIEAFYKHELHRYAKTLIPDLKVMLLGQGADEFAGGYSNPQDTSRFNWEEYSNVLKLEVQDFFLALKTPQKLNSDDILPSYPINFTPSSIYHQEMLRRVVMLQTYNLWHEDRTASSQGVESRVPFLDHRLVEFLAAIPPEHHAPLFWNKTIIRQMASKWLPSHLAFREKMHSHLTPGMSELMQKLIVKIFPAFQEKYLDSSKTLFNKERLLALRDRIALSDSTDIKTMEKLLNCMAMAVFANLCQSMTQDRPLGYLNAPSPLESNRLIGSNTISP
jgi:asparagine synthase (glutamine-hydrolysing)